MAKLLRPLSGSKRIAHVVNWIARNVVFEEARIDLQAKFVAAHSQHFDVRMSIGAELLRSGKPAVVETVSGDLSFQELPASMVEVIDLRPRGFRFESARVPFRPEQSSDPMPFLLQAVDIDAGPITAPIRLHLRFMVQVGNYPRFMAIGRVWAHGQARYHLLRPRAHDLDITQPGFTEDWKLEIPPVETAPLRKPEMFSVHIAVCTFTNGGTDDCVRLSNWVGGPVILH